MPVPKTDALPLGYTPYGLVLDGRTNGERGKGEEGLEERDVQERGDIASKQQVLPSRPYSTSYNKLATLIEERDGKLSALFACNAFTYQSWRTLL